MNFRQILLTFHVSYAKIISAGKRSGRTEVPKAEELQEFRDTLSGKGISAEAHTPLPCALAIRANTLFAVTLVMRFRHFLFCGKRARARSFYRLEDSK